MYFVVCSIVVLIKRTAYCSMLPIVLCNFVYPDECFYKIVCLNFQPLLREMARGLIIEYCVEYIGQRRSIKKLFPARDHPSWLHISGLQSDVDYYFTLRAGNSQGYNDSLKVQPVHISRSDRGNEFTCNAINLITFV